LVIGDSDFTLEVLMVKERFIELSPFRRILVNEFNLQRRSDRNRFFFKDVHMDKHMLVIRDAPRILHAEKFQNTTHTRVGIVIPLTQANRTVCVSKSELFVDWVERKHLLIKLALSPYPAYLWVRALEHLAESTCGELARRAHLVIHLNGVRLLETIINCKFGQNFDLETMTLAITIKSHISCLRTKKIICHI